jgi:hypothetical protein
MNESLQEKINEASKKDDEINSKAESLKERIKAYPENRKNYTELRILYMKAASMWDDLTKELKEEDASCTDEEEKAEIVKNIIFCQEMASMYRDESKQVFRDLVNDSKSHKAGKTIQEVGEAMKEHGDSMTRGCTIPFLIGLIVLFLLMMIL